MLLNQFIEVTTAVYKIHHNVFCLSLVIVIFGWRLKRCKKSLLFMTLCFRLSMGSLADSMKLFLHRVVLKQIMIIFVGSFTFQKMPIMKYIIPIGAAQSRLCMLFNTIDISCFWFCRFRAVEIWRIISRFFTPLKYYPYWQLLLRCDYNMFLASNPWHIRDKL